MVELLVSEQSVRNSSPFHSYYQFRYITSDDIPLEFDIPLTHLVPSFSNNFQPTLLNRSIVNNIDCETRNNPSYAENGLDSGIGGVLPQPILVVQ